MTTQEVLNDIAKRLNVHTDEIYILRRTLQEISEQIAAFLKPPDVKMIEVPEESILAIRRNVTSISLSSVYINRIVSICDELLEENQS